MKNKNLLILFITIFLISCGSESINNDVQNPVNPTDDIEEISPEEEVLDDTTYIRYFYNDFSEGLYDIANYEVWYNESGERLSYLDSNFYNTTDDRLELNYTDPSGKSIALFVFHSTNGKTYDDNSDIIGYQESNNIENLAEGDKITIKINYTLPDNSSINGIYADILWLDGNVLGNNNLILFNVEDRFRYGDDYTPLVKGETNTLEVEFILNPDNSPFDFNSIYFDLVLEADYSDNTKAKLFINSVEILRE